MSHDNHASYVKIGLTVVIGLAAIVGTLVYLGGFCGRDDVLLVETCYDKPVSGLSVGSAVNFRGVPLGEVREIGFIGGKYDVEGADNSRIYILMALRLKDLCSPDENKEDVKARLRMMVDKLGLRATVTASGITGLSRIELDFNRREDLGDTPSISWVPKHVYVPSKISLLDSFGDSATKVMNQINRMDLNAAWSNFSASVTSLARTMQAAQTIMETRQGDLDRLVDDLSEISASFKAFAKSLERNPSLILRERIPARLEETE